MCGLYVAPQGRELGEVSAIWTAFPFTLEQARLIKLGITRGVSWSRVTLEGAAPNLTYNLIQVGRNHHTDRSGLDLKPVLTEACVRESLSSIQYQH